MRAVKRRKPCGSYVLRPVINNLISPNLTTSQSYKPYRRPCYNGGDIFRSYIQQRVMVVVSQNAG